MAGARQPMVNLLQIDFDEIEDREIVGRGSYGTVYKAEWQNRYVAVKEFYVNAEQKAIESEIKQLSRVVHPNIIALYGVSAKNGCIYLVMEFAEGGTLHNFLHGNSEPYYSAAHAMSWARQCAEGAAYLHAMQPKPLIHRDLKPLNLLLVNHGRNLKICDFGTVADKATLMTNNKGSAAWMAPEVFEGHKYTEKCDVFSWGIILWEMLSRQQPFKEYKEALPIMWGVHKGDRPPLIEGCPKPIEDLYTSCWSHSPAIRPSMKHIVEIMTKLCEFFPGADQPLDYKSTTDPPQASTDLSETDTTIGNKSFSLSSLNSSQKAPTNTDSVRNLANMFNNLSQANSATSGGKRTPRLSSNASSSTLNSDPIPEDKEVKFKAPDEYISPHFNDPYRLKPSAETTNRAEIIRNGILKGSPKSPISVNIDENAWELGAQPKSVGNDLSKSDGKERLVVKETKSVIPEDDDESPNASPVDYEYSDHQSLHEMLDPSLQPEPPIPNNRLSQELYQEHIRLAKEYLRVDTQLYYAKDDRDKYLATLDPVEREQKEAFLRKHSEKEELLELYKNLKQQLESKRAAQQNHNTSDPQTSRSAKLPSQMSSEGLATEVVDDGWLVIAPKESNT